MTGAVFPITDDVVVPPPSRNVGPAAAPPSARSSNEEPAPSSSIRAAEEEEEEEEEELRRVKGKMPGVYESPPRASSKLMGDAIRCHDASNKKRKQHDHRRAFWFGTGPDGQSTSSAGSDLPVSLSTLPVASARLRAALHNLGVQAADPTRAYGKMMSRSDRVKQQCRLLMSCKSWRAAADGPFPVDAFLTGTEKAAARGREGLEVLALDRDGEAYAGMRCKYLDSNAGYRVIGRWGAFLRRNGLVVTGSNGDAGGGGSRRVNDVMVDLWMFRAAGRVGIVFVHYRKGDAAHADAAFEEEMGRPPQKARTRRRGGAGDSASEEDEDVGSEDDVMVEDGGVAMRNEGGCGNDVGMEGAAYDALREKETPTLSDAIIGAKAVEEESTSSKGKAAVTLAPQAADGANEGKANSPSSSNVDDAEAGASLSSDDGAKEEETAARAMAAEPLPLSSCKQEVLEAARTLMRISRGFW